MSLYRQLWAALALILVIAFVVSFSVSTFSAKRSLTEQIQLKNADNTNALALALTQLADDPIAIELLIAAQFDTGHYEYIRLTDPEGGVIIERIRENANIGVPAWVGEMISFAAPPGVASVQKGWLQLGTLTLASDVKFAYVELWTSTKQLLIYFLLIYVVCGFGGARVLKIVTQPLHSVVDQARALGERRFIQIPEPRTLEFKELVRSMNTLSEKIRSFFEGEAGRLEQLRRDSHLDSLTQTLDRPQFIKQLGKTIHDDQAAALGVISLFRIRGLQKLNRSHGREVADILLKETGATLNRFVDDNPGWAAGRLNGSDFAILSPGAVGAKETAMRIQEALLLKLEALELSDAVDMPMAVYAYKEGDDVSDVLGNVDSAFASAETLGESALEIFIPPPPDNHRHDAEEWRDLLETTFSNGNIELQCYPVVNNAYELVHLESCARITTDGGDPVSARMFMTWVNRLGYGSKLDHAVINNLDTLLAREQAHVSIHLTNQSIADPELIRALMTELGRSPDRAQRVWIEIPEYSCYQHLDNFRLLCDLARPLGSKVGIEHAGLHIEKIGHLHDIGIDFLKIDQSLVRGIDSTPSNQVYLRGLCTIAHSICELVLAEGLHTDAEWETLKTLGVDGGSGVLIDLPLSD